VYVTEGERDVKTVEKLGLAGTTSGAAGSWRAHHTQQLLEYGCREAVVLPDYDTAGEDHAYDVCRANLAAHLPTKLLRLPNLQEHQDVTDFVEAGGTVEQLVQLAQQAPWIEFSDIPPAKPVKSKSSPPANWKYDERLSRFYIETLKLSPNARGRIMAICPFHADVKESLSLDLTRGLWNCFACNAGGSVFTFYMRWHQLHGKTVLKTEARRRLERTYL
jgi:DNA primase